MPGQDIYVAVAHKQGAGRVCVQVLHQAVNTGGVGLGGYARAAAPHQNKPTCPEIMLDDLAAQRVSLVGEHRALHACGVQRVNEGSNARVRRGLVLLVSIVPGGKLRQRSGQLLRCAGIGGRKPLHELRDAVAHHVLELLHRKLRPPVLCAHPVACISQVVNGVQQSAVQIK